MPDTPVGAGRPSSIEGRDHEQASTGDALGQPVIPDRRHGRAGASVSVAQGPSPAAAQDCLPPTTTDPDASSAIDGETVTDSAGNQLRVVEVATGLDPAGIAVDATDAWGRVFVADRGSDQLTSCTVAHLT